MRTSTETTASPEGLVCFTILSHLLPSPARQGTGRFTQGGRLRLTEDHEATSTRVAGPSLLPLSRLRAPVSPVSFYLDTNSPHPSSHLDSWVSGRALDLALRPEHLGSFANSSTCDPHLRPTVVLAGDPAREAFELPEGFSRQPWLGGPGKPSQAHPLDQQRLPYPGTCRKSTLSCGAGPRPGVLADPRQAGGQAEPGPRPRDKA